MSRSKKKSPIIPITCAESEKQDKRLARKAWRRENKVRVKKGRDPILLQEAPPDRWTFAKDGKHWINKEDFPEDYFRKLIGK